MEFSEVKSKTTMLTYVVQETLGKSNIWLDVPFLEPTDSLEEADVLMLEYVEEMLSEDREELSASGNHCFDNISSKYPLTLRIISRDEICHKTLVVNCPKPFEKLPEKIEE